MKKEGLITPCEKKKLYVEYGAGKAGLSQYIGQSFKESDRFSFLVVERESRRNKKEN